MSPPSVEDIAKANTDALIKSTGDFGDTAVQELIKAYQELATKNANNVMAAIQALSAVKSPAEFIELQQRLIKDGVDAAVRDSEHIAQLTHAVFTAASEPVKKQIEAAQTEPVKKQVEAVQKAEAEQGAEDRTELRVCATATGEAPSVLTETDDSLIR